MASIRFELHNKPDKRGRRQIRIIIQDGKKRKFIPTSVKVYPHEWDNKLQVLKQEYPNSYVINNTLRLKRSELEASISIDELNNDFNIDKLAGRNITKVPFDEFASDCIHRWIRKKAKNSIRCYRSMLNKVNEYDRDLKLTDIDSGWLINYEAWCRTPRINPRTKKTIEGCGDGGTLKRIAFVSLIINEALRMGKIRFNPFFMYRKPKKINPARVWLTIDEISLIKNYVDTTDSETLRTTGLWFLLSCYTGFRYSDAKRFDKEKDITGGRVILYTQKTGEVVSIKIHNRLKEIMSLMGDIEIMSNQKMNQYLKAIVHFTGIDKPITFHSGRHTFAVNCANLGISQEVVSKLLGHSDLRTTGLYYKIINTRIDKEMDKWE